MKRKVTNNSYNFNGKVVNVGIDVHKVSWHVTALVEGIVVEWATIKPSYRVLKKLLAPYKGARIRIAYEAGFSGFNLYDELTADGMECIVVSTSLIPFESGNRVRTDKKDSTKLAHYLENNLLKQVWVLSEKERAHRQFVRTRRQLSDHRTDVMRQIKSLLLFHGLPSFDGNRGFWTKPDYVVVQYSPWLVSRALDPFAPAYFGKAPTSYFYTDDGVALHPPVFRTKLTDFQTTIYRNSPESAVDFISFLWNVGLPLLIHDDFHMSCYFLKRTFGLIPKLATNDSEIVSYVYEEIAKLVRKENAKLVIVLLGKNHKPVEVPRHLLPADSMIVDAHNALLEQLLIVDKESYNRNYAHWRGSPPRIVDRHPNEKAHKIIAEEIVLKITGITETQ